ncbi:MAG: hypothetical protein ACOVVK_05000 [Elsteraceae bacterium]
MTEFGFLCGFKAEADLLKEFPFVAFGDGGIEGARRALTRLPLAQVTALVSFGVAGGLKPGLVPGSLLIPDEILIDGRAIPTDRALAEDLRAKLPQALRGRMAAGAGLLATVEAKSGLHARTQALAVDLESGPLAEAAQGANLPFLILRAVADPSDRALPKAAQIPLTPSGTPNLPAILASVLRSPGQIPGLIALGLEMNRAMASLRQAATALKGYQ